MKLNCEGFVIWQTKTGDANRVITLLTPAGVVTAFAKNSRRPGSKLTGATALFAYSDFELFYSGSMFNVDEAACREKFTLSDNVEGFALATYFCELMKHMAPIEDDAADYLSLMLNSLYLISEKLKPLPMIKAVFELRLLSLAGYMPDLEACSVCGGEHTPALLFDCAGGGWVCGKCAEARGALPICSAAVLLAMRHITSAAAGEIFSFSLPEAQLRNLCELAESYLLYQSERDFQTLGYYKKLCGNLQ